MKTYQFVVFLTVVLSFYTLLNLYIFNRGLQAVSSLPWLKITYITFFIFLFSAYIIARSIERSGNPAVFSFFLWTGSFWLGAMTYFFLIVLALDILRLIHHFIPFFPAFITANYEKTRLVTFLSSFVIVIAISIIGYFNFISPFPKHIELKLDKKFPASGSFSIAMVSDIHLGHIVGEKQLLRIIDLINKGKPDLVLIAGDVVDERIEPLISKKLGEHFMKINAPLGVYAITGNHEHIGGADRAVKYLSQYNITFLRDSLVKVADELWLLGREDRDMQRFSGRMRKSLDELLAKLDTTMPVVLLDHQPFDYTIASEKGVDLLLSGHTHHGQIWPLNFITRASYQNSYGLMAVGAMHAYVSCGAGGWGPPMRIGSRPEVVFFHISSKQ